MYKPISGGENKSKYNLPSLALNKSSQSTDSDPAPEPYVCAACQRNRCHSCVSLRCQHTCHKRETQGLAAVKRERQEELRSHKHASGRF